MPLQHLHLHVRDRTVAEQFYATWFGMTLQRRGETISFLHDEREFLLALMHDPAPAAMPAWFHYGFRLAAASDVTALHDRMTQAGVTIAKPIYQDESLVSYRCTDPDAYVIEVYWEA